MESNFDQDTTICLGDEIELNISNLASENQFETSPNDELIISEFCHMQSPHHLHRQILSLAIII